MGLCKQTFNHVMKVFACSGLIGSHPIFVEPGERKTNQRGLIIDAVEHAGKEIR